jgi:CheY-like chemotaxis protein
MAGEIKVLVVDDNPMVLGLLERTLAPLAAVTTAASGAEALRQVATSLPDLIISDFQMPGMDGRQLLDKLKENPATAEIPLVLAASRNDMSELLKPLQDRVEDFLEKPFFASEAAARIKRILRKIALEKMAHSAPGETTMRGSLAQMNVIDLLQSLEMGRKTCLLTLKQGDEQGKLFFREGQMNHAVCGSLSGDSAVYKTLTWTEAEGSFQIDFAAASSEQTITRSTQSLLMEGLRLLDEANRDAGEQDG